MKEKSAIAKTSFEKLNVNSVTNEDGNNLPDYMYVKMVKVAVKKRKILEELEKAHVK